VFEIRSIWESIEALDNKISASVQHSMLRATSQALLKQATRWLLDRRNELPDIARSQCSGSIPGVMELIESACPRCCSAAAWSATRARPSSMRIPACPSRWRARSRRSRPMHVALDIIALAENCKVGVRHAADIYFRVGDALQLDWISDQVDSLRVEGMWQAKARGSAAG
jgi:glutamate dehydrogenase